MSRWALLRGFAERLSIGQTAVDVLAQARAEVIRDELLARGVDPGPSRAAALRHNRLSLEEETR